MEESLRDAPPADDWRSSLARRVQDQRQRTRDQVEAQRQRLRDLETRLASQLDEAVSALAREQEQLREAAGKAGSSTVDFDRRAQELATAQSQLAQQEQRLASELESYRVAKSLADSEAERLREQEAHLRQLESELAGRQQQLAERERTTQRQRRHVADQLRARKKELTAEIELHRSEALVSGAGQEVQLQMRLAELQGKHDRLREDLAQREHQRDEATQRAAELKGQLEAHSGELTRQHAACEALQERLAQREGERLRLADVEQQLAEARQQLAEARQQLEASQAASHQNHSDSSAQATAAARQAEELERQRAADQAAWGRERSRLESELAALKKSQGAAGDAGPELDRLREENKQLEAWLAEAEEKAKHAASGAGDNQELDDLQRRFEMAVQDVRDLKTKNNELTEQLTKARQSGGAPAAAGGGTDWESMKRKLLEQLETDLDPADEKQAADKLTVEGTIKITDEMIARKEEEIRELQRLLDSQSQNVGEVAVGASAIAQMLDADELVKQERDNLQKMQDALREQLRKAEVDISLERAKLARERAELDEKLRALEEGRASGGPVDESISGGKGGKQPARGKWLTRLGLQGGKDE